MADVAILTKMVLQVRTVNIAAQVSDYQCLSSHFVIRVYMFLVGEIFILSADLGPRI